MSDPTSSTQRPGALELALSSEQKLEFCDWLLQQTGVTGTFIQQAAQERYGVKVGLGAAYTFKDKLFDQHLEKLRKRKERAALLKDSTGNEDTLLIADNAAGNLAQLLFDFTLDGLDGLDPNDKNDRATIKAIGQEISRVRRDDAARRAEIRDLQDKLAAAEAEQKRQQAAVDKATLKDSTGMTVAARNALRLELGLPLLTPEAA